jgi:hypothetical protein
VMATEKQRATILNAPLGRASPTRAPAGGLVILNAAHRLGCSFRFAPLVWSAPLHSAWCPCRTGGWTRIGQIPARVSDKSGILG